MGRPKSVSDETILRTARKLILEHGPNVSTQVIADALGISQPALFKRFKTKSRLICSALVEPGHLHPLTIIGDAPTDEPADQQLIRIGTELSRFCDTWIPRLLMLRADSDAALMNQALMEMEVPPPVQTTQAMATWFSQAHERGLVRADQPEAVATVFLGGIHSASMLTHLRRQTRTEEETRLAVIALVSTLFEGIKPAEGSC